MVITFIRPGVMKNNNKLSDTDTSLWHIWIYFIFIILIFCRLPNPVICFCRSLTFIITWCKILICLLLRLSSPWKELCCLMHIWKARHHAWPPAEVQPLMKIWASWRTQNINHRCNYSQNVRTRRKQYLVQTSHLTHQ